MLMHFLAIQVFLLSLTAYCSAQAFRWKFGDSSVSTVLQECQRLPIVIQPVSNGTSAIGVPPYYLIAFELGGVPTTTMVGADTSSLSWQVNHKSGSALQLAMIDSNSSSGGILPDIYNVTAGTTTSCLPTIPTTSSLATIQPNVTSLSTCQPWGLQISGGKKPYQVVLSVPGAKLFTNVTMGPEDNIFTYINRANPSSELMASVVDSNGQWGISTFPILTTGSADTTCPGLTSSSRFEPLASASQSAQGSPGPTGLTASSGHRTNQPLILGLVLGLGLPLVLGLLVFLWRYRTRRSGMSDGVDPTPRPYPALSSGRDHMRETEANAGVYIQRKWHPAGHVTNSAGRSATSAAESSGLATLPASSSSLDSLPRVPGPATQHHQNLQAHPGSVEIPSLPPTLSTQPVTSSQSSLPLVARPVIPEKSQPRAIAIAPPGLEPDIIIQHHDGGPGIVQELPPPYAARRRGF